MRALVLALIVCAHLSGAPAAAAANEMGNGGDAVVCRDESGAITSAEMYDYFEATNLREIPLDLGGDGLDEWQRVEYVLARLGLRQPAHARHYRDLVTFFRSEMRVVANVDFIDIPDSDPLVLPTGCEVKQAAIQRTPTFPEDRHFLVSAEIWNAMRTRDRAGLILHEVLYFDLIQAGATNSVAARYLNSILSSPVSEAYSAEKFNELFKRVGASWIEWEGGAYKMDSLQFSDGALVAGVLVKEHDYPAPARYRDPAAPNLRLYGKVEYAPDGTLLTAHYVYSGRLFLPRYGKVVAIGGGGAWFRADGAAQFSTECDPGVDGSIEIVRANGVYRMDGCEGGHGGRMQLSEDGSVQNYSTSFPFQAPAYLLSGASQLPISRLDFGGDGSVFAVFRAGAAGAEFALHDGTLTLSPNGTLVFDPAGLVVRMYTGNVELQLGAFQGLVDGVKWQPEDPALGEGAYYDLEDVTDPVPLANGETLRASRVRLYADGTLKAGFLQTTQNLSVAGGVIQVVRNLEFLHGRPWRVVLPGSRTMCKADGTTGSFSGGIELEESGCVVGPWVPPNQ